MKRSFVGICVFLFILYSVFFNVYPLIRGKSIADNYLNDIMQENYHEASQYVNQSKNNSTLDHDLQFLKKAGIHLSGFKDVHIEADDGWMAGKATLTLNDHGSEIDYPVYIIFGGNRLNPSISHFESLDKNENLSLWLSANK
ncbi:hypothetical protein [Paenibacillus lutrae]|uniref:Uncharacterized protein n=1 Tax=Paenibacillus lutrae TaxID=2078573 RepID=A0A7X3FMK6_9BACL|nr:hypothetical protein [Paenibacillus lutrae]MVP02042.1 hypothetical protein [Paenibacillus lutrae]